MRLIDLTGLRLSGVGAEWARFSTAVFGAKAHVVYDPDLGRPVYHAVTAANVNDITAAKEMPIEAGATYVFDLGYYDFAFWAKLDASGGRLVTRFKTNTPLNAPRDMPLFPGSTLLSDRIGDLPARQAMNRKNRMQDAVREIAVKTETGETLRLMTNDLDAPAQEIADLYKRRWRIELFFRLMKQTLRITKFVGRSENAVRIQIAVALIAYLLMRALQQITKDVPGFLELVRTLRANLMHRRDLTRLRNRPSPSAIHFNQLQLCLSQLEPDSRALDAGSKIPDAQRAERITLVGDERHAAIEPAVWFVHDQCRVIEPEILSDVGHHQHFSAAYRRRANRSRPRGVSSPPPGVHIAP